MNYKHFYEDWYFVICLLYTRMYNYWIFSMVEAFNSNIGQFQFFSFDGMSTLWGYVMAYRTSQETSNDTI